MQVQACKVEVSSFDLSKAMTFSKIFSKVKLSPSARLVLRCLVDFYNPKKGLVYPGQELISECTGVSSRSITNAVDELRKASLILTTKKGSNLNYHFSNIFFELVEVADHTRKNCSSSPAKIADKQHENNKINNKHKILNFQKNYSQPEGVDYPSVEKTQEYLAKQKNIKTGSPLDYTYEQAKQYLGCLMPELKNSYFARELRKKWCLE